MAGLSWGEALLGLALASALLWGAVFGLAYARRRFGGSAGAYLRGFGATWAATILLFVLLALWESRGLG